jgi:hypothetical protein
MLRDGTVRPLAPKKWCVSRHGYFAITGQRAQCRDAIANEVRLGRRETATGRIARPPQIALRLTRHHEHVVRHKSPRGPTQPDEAGNQEQRSDGEDDRHRRLHGDEQITEPWRAAAPLRDGTVRREAAL